jgi:glutamyl-tRNA(Gln) amidotransferase subunit D
LTHTINKRSEGETVVSLEGSGYNGLVIEKLTQAGVSIGDTVKIIHSGREYVGVLMPRAQIGSDPDHLVIKLDNGYNIGICLEQNSEVSKTRGSRKKKRSTAQIDTVSDTTLPTVTILSTGGTIASKVDYKTGAVNPALTAQDLYDTVPEMRNHANIEARVVMSVLSENIRPADWTKIARAVASAIKKGVDGVVIAHGTDTLGFTSAALSFALQELPVPVALVGSQRSSDRPSSDAALNLLGATELVGGVDAAEVMLVMHGETADTFLYAHRGTRARKCHTSRRDAFQSINSHPLFKINKSSITELSPPRLRRNPDRTLKLKPKFDDRVALVKTYPGMTADVIDSIIDKNYLGLIIEGTGLGHAPEHVHDAFARAIDEGLVLAMTSQCISGRVDMNVYRPGVKMLEMGILPCEDMIAETALVKLMWLFGNLKETEKVKSEMTRNIVGEIEMRTEQSEYVFHKEDS